MSRTITPGTQSFMRLRENNYFYIDKTEFIKNWWNAGIDVTLITRPRRFGKTLMLDTVKTFFSLECRGRSDLFESLKIWEDEELRKMQGTIPVIFLSFANIKSKRYEDAIKKFKELIVGVYDEFRSQFQNIYFSITENEQISSIRQSMENYRAQSSVHHLCKYLYRIYGIKPIVLLDEYDTPLQEAWLNGYWDKLIEFICEFFNSTFKTNPFLGRGLITGITKIAQNSIFSDINNIEVITTTSNSYSCYFGFTENEVFAAMDEYGLTSKDEVKQWYDGFIFGQQKEIYNPWSIINFIKNNKFSPYWADTSSNALVGELFAHGDESIKRDTETLSSNKFENIH